ncbi:MAG TPA: hypothetical protein VF658_03985 [Pyrinomonadaceae bacterium]|jgi:hypothetical protein
MSETRTAQTPEWPPVKIESIVTLKEEPKLLEGESPSPFKLKLTSLAGTDLAFLGQNINGAVAYQSYCIAGNQGSTRILTPIVYNGLTYFQDQAGNWLSYETIWNMLYMSYWINAVAWEIRGNRFVRVQDGAVLTCRPPRHWPLASPQLYLSAEPEGDYSLNVKWVNALE